MSKHTDGPWYWSDAYKTGDGKHTWTLMRGEGVNGYGILSCDGYENSPQAHNDADARLIAAAPDLLAELEGLLCYEPVRRVAPDKLARCWAAIAKARGTT